MLETTSKTVSKCIQFEKSKEKIILSVSIENIDNQKIWKTKDFLEAMFKEILKRNKTLNITYLFFR